MLRIITGVPGAGKTSNTLDEVLYSKAYAERPKFILNVRSFDFSKAPNCSELTREGLEDWKTLPPASVIVIDEAYDFFPKAGAGKEIPEWIKDIAKHRHYGIDFFLITQNAAMLHHHIRALVEEHIHYHRISKGSAGRYSWPRLQANVDAKQVRAEAAWKVVNTPARVFQLYESTVLDTAKSRFPWSKVAFIVGGIVLALFLLSYAFRTVTKSGDDSVSQVSSALPGIGQPVGVQTTAPDRASAKRRTLADYQPRNSLDPSSAPIYDNLTEPTDFPRVAACMVIAHKVCRCYTQQATPVKSIPQDVCALMIKEGWFDPWKTGRQEGLGLATHTSTRSSSNSQGSQIIDANDATWTQTPTYTADLLKAAGTDF